MNNDPFFSVQLLNPINSLIEFATKKLTEYPQGWK